MILTSPNQDWVPEHPVERRIVRTYRDGLWGLQEYSRWPQPFLRNMWHLPCIPTPLDTTSRIPRILRYCFRSEHDWVEEPTVGYPGLGYLKPHLRDELKSAAQHAVRRFCEIRHVPDHRLLYGRSLAVLVRQCVERIYRLPSYSTVTISVAAHIQRVSLELHGLVMYLTVVLPCIESAGDFSQSVLPILGAFCRDAGTAQLCFRVGIPIWLLQPLTRHVKIWAVVKTVVPSMLSQTETSPPMRHHPDELGTLANLTGSESFQLVLHVTEQLCSTALPTLPHVSPVSIATAAQFTPGATALISLSPVQAQAPVPNAQGQTRKTRRSGKRVKAATARATKRTEAGRPGATPTPPNLSSAAIVDDRPPEWRHPSREFSRSPFARISDPWAIALTSVGTLRQASTSVKYFYPPPFLLDTVSSRTNTPLGAFDAHALRHDEKVHRYLHNLARIRHFCRLRLLDPAISGQALSIAEWRAALWGDYQLQEDVTPPRCVGDARRLKHKIDNKNDIAQLFGGAGAMAPYSASMVVQLGDMEVSEETAATDERIRRLLLWESHEINFRCELMALDACFVPRSDWPLIRRWARESLVSECWGPPASLSAVVPAIPPDDEPFCWQTSAQHEWCERITQLVRFLDLLVQ